MAQSAPGVRSRNRPGVETSLDAARKSASATCYGSAKTWIPLWPRGVFNSGTSADSS